MFAIAWALLALGALLVIACVVLAVRFTRQKPAPAKSPSQLWAETDRYYDVEDLPANGAEPQPGRRPLIVLGSLAVVAVVALVAGGFLLQRERSDEPAAAAAPAGSAAPAATVAGSAAPAVTVAAKPTPSTKPSAADAGPPSIRAGYSDLCLSAKYDGDGAPVLLRECKFEWTQQWKTGTDGTVRIGNRCLDVAGAEKAVGTALQLADCTDNKAQRFRFDQGKLVSELTGNCVDLAKGQVTIDAAVAIKRCADVGDRVWRPLP